MEPSPVAFLVFLLILESLFFGQNELSVPTFGEKKKGISEKERIFPHLMK